MSKDKEKTPLLKSDATPKPTDFGSSLENHTGSGTEEKEAAEARTRTLSSGSPMRHMHRQHIDVHVHDAHCGYDPSVHEHTPVTSRGHNYGATGDDGKDLYPDLEGGSHKSFEHEETPEEGTLRAAAEAAEEDWPTGCCGVKDRKKRDGVRKYYRYNCALLDHFAIDAQLLDEGVHGEAAMAKQDANFARMQRLDVILAQITFGLNVVLLIAKVTAAILSRSLSIFSTVIDSLVDLTSGLVIWLTLRAIKRVNPLEYPRGRNKLEPLAVIVVAIIMGAANLVMIIQSLQSIITNSMDPNVDLFTLIILSSGTAIKAVLLVICLRHKTPSSVVLAMDQRNDIITNLVALGMGAIGTFYWKLADPIGAILVSSYIAFSWFYTGADQIPILTGRAASGEFTARITKIIVTHDPRIDKLDALWVYHYGVNFLVEVHIVLRPDMSLQESHDLAEPLTLKLEKMPYVERAFVHCDYRVDSIDHGGK